MRTFVSHDMSNTTKKKMKKKTRICFRSFFYIEGVSEILRPFTQVIVDAIFVALSNATSVAAELAVKISLQAGSLGATREWRSRELLLRSTARALKRISEDHKCEQAAILLPR